jgi:hypothetical protein
MSSFVSLINYTAIGVLFKEILASGLVLISPFFCANLLDIAPDTDSGNKN